MNKILNYKEVISNKNDNELSLLVDAINKKLMLNQFPFEFYFKSGTQQENIWKIVKFLREEGWNVTVTSDNDNSDVKESIIVSPLIKTMEDRNHEILMNSNYNYSSTMNNNSFSCTLQGDLYRDDCSVDKECNLNAIVTVNIEANGVNRDVVENAIIEKLKTLKEAHNYRTAQTLSTFKGIVEGSRRTGKSTALIKAARSINGWVIVATINHAQHLIENHGYNKIISLGEMKSLIGKREPIFIDDSVFYAI